jgi:transcription elongation GreA/GreB family factor
VSALALRTFPARAPIAMSALVTVDEDGREQRFFLAPAGGGTLLSGGVQVVTPSSPLGRALLGKRIADEVELALAGKRRTFDIAAIS